MHTAAAVAFWDFDGTLAHREGMWSSALASAANAVAPGCGVTAARLRPHLQAGFPWHEPTIIRAPLTPTMWWTQLRPVMLAALAESGVDRRCAEAAVGRLPAEYYRPDAWKVVSGAAAALSATRAVGIRNVILSNHPPELPQLVEAIGLGSFVVETITSASVGAEKPHRRIFEAALTRAQVRAADAVMVGDSVSADIAGARAVGMRAILVNGADRVTLSEAARRIIANEDAER